MPRLIPLLALMLCASASAGLRADITKGTPHGSGAIKVYDGQTLLFQATTRGLSAVTASKFSPDGRWLVNLTDQGYVQLWDVHKGERVKTFLAPFARVLNADFTPDSTRLLLNFWGDSTPTNFWQGTRSSFWSLEPVQRLGTLDGKGWDIGYSGNVHFDAAGKRMVTASFRFFGGQAAAVYDAATGALIATFQRVPYPPGALQTGGAGAADARLAPDGRRALVYDVAGRLVEYDAATGQLLKVRSKVDSAEAGPQLERFAREGK